MIDLQTIFCWILVAVVVASALIAFIGITSADASTFEEYKHYKKDNEHTTFERYLYQKRVRALRHQTSLIFHQHSKYPSPSGKGFRNQEQTFLDFLALLETIDLVATDEEFSDDIFIDIFSALDKVLGNMEQYDCAYSPSHEQRRFRILMNSIPPAVSYLTSLDSYQKHVEEEFEEFRSEYGRMAL